MIRSKDAQATVYQKHRSLLSRKTMQSASRLSPRFLEKTAALIVETDKKMKTSTDDPKRLLEVLLLEISREARNG